MITLIKITLPNGKFLLDRYSDKYTCKKLLNSYLNTDKSKLRKSIQFKFIDDLAKADKTLILIAELAKYQTYQDSLLGYFHWIKKLDATNPAIAYNRLAECTNPIKPRSPQIPMASVSK